MKVPIIILSLLVVLLIAGTESKLCPDSEQECSDGQTCCPLTQGGFGCCPYEGASCCNDGAHCCPHDSTCDLAHARCIRNPSAKSSKNRFSDGWRLIFDSFTPEELRGIEDNSLSTFPNATTTVNENFKGLGKKCPDGESTCPEKYTCCSLSTGGFGCCPYQGATCCPDQIHCCPSGETCDDKKGACVKQ